MLSAFDIASILIVLAAILGYINHQFLKLPSSVGLTVMGAVASLVVIAADRLVPSMGIGPEVVGFLSSIDFHATLMEGMLSFLLFAGALHVDWSEMRRGRWPILILSTVGVVISTILVGAGFYMLSGLIGYAVPWIWCLVFGALISPTDPVAVLGALKRSRVPPTLQATVAGESLFNDGVGVVVFSILLAIAMGTKSFALSAAAQDFLREAGGGVLLGIITGWVAYRAMRSIDEYNVEVMISLAVVMGGYSLAHWLHVSGPVAMAVAGLLIGNAGVAYAMSDVTQDYVLKFWALMDEILNAILFLLIGMEVITIITEPKLLLLGLLVIPLVIMGRIGSVGLPMALLKSHLTMGKLTLPILVWGGLRGGISVALALSLPDNPIRPVILSATYVVVLFAVIVQGGSISALIKHLSASETKTPHA